MTREEAVKILKECRETKLKYTFYTLNEYQAATDMAIKALEQEPCEDCTSRQAVLEGLRTCYDTETKEFSDGSKWINYEDAVAEIDNLPPVTPKQEIGRWKRVSIDKYIQHAMAYYKCSECGGQTIGQTEYCPNCGAKMEVEE